MENDQRNAALLIHLSLELQQPDGGGQFLPAERIERMSPCAVLLLPQMAQLKSTRPSSALALPYEKPAADTKSVEAPLRRRARKDDTS